MIIRPFRPTDTDAVMEIWRQCNLSAHPFVPPGYWLDNESSVRDMLPLADLYVVADDGVVAFAGLQDNYIAGLFVAAGRQSEGIGRRLVAFLKSRYVSLSLSVYEKNRRAVAFYLREGFREEARGVDSATGEREILMSWSAGQADAV